MVKILNSGSNDMLLNPEQYNDCSNLLMKAADEPPLEELDPAILSCGLPAIILSDIKPILAAHIRYTVSQLLALRNSSLSKRRPAVVDDPKIGNYRIWRLPSQSKGVANASRNNNILSASPTITFNKDDNRTDRGINRNNFNAANPGRHERQQFQDRQRHFNSRESAYVAPRFRRQYEFSDRQHHVIVKSYRGNPDYNNHCLQDTVIEEEPEWVSAGPTSRLDTIELRGFDDDVHLPGLSTSQSSPEKAASGILVDSKGGSRNSSSEKHISFYDDLHHYEHIHAKRGGSGGSKLLDSSSGREHDVESVATSNTSSPPPARSTPTKPSEHGYDASADNNGVNVNNFEQFMKFDSFLGPENSSNNSNNNVQPGSRFSKWFRRGNNSSPNNLGGNYHNNGYGGDRRQSSYYSGYNNYNNYDNFGSNQNYRYQYDRNQQQYQHQHRFQTGGMGGARSYGGAYEHHLTADSNVAFKRLVDMVAQNRASNNMLAQQQYLMQLLNKNQQTEILRRMIMKNAVDNVADSNSSSPQQQQQQQPQEANQQQSPQQRVPTHRELQFHTQSIMQNALLRKKLQDQRKTLFEQSNQIAAVAALAAANSVASEANPIVQQFVQSVCPNIQRSLSVLCQTATGVAASQMNQSKFAAVADRDSGEITPQGTNNPSMFPGGQTQHELSASLQQMLQQGPQQRSESSSNANGQRQRFGKGRSVTWNTSVN